MTTWFSRSRTAGIASLSDGTFAIEVGTAEQASVCRGQRHAALARRSGFDF